MKVAIVVHKRGIARIALHDLLAPRTKKISAAPSERQEGDDGEHGPARHQCAPPSMYQVKSAATPISMVKA